jgi:chromosome segregation ATPase
MEDNAALIQEYRLTIESMQAEVDSLKFQLSTSNLSPEELRQELESLTAEIEEKFAEVSEKNSSLTDLQAEQDWLSFKYPK